jgi:hypothetical protein
LPKQQTKTTPTSNFFGFGIESNPQYYIMGVPRANFPQNNCRFMSLAGAEKNSREHVRASGIFFRKFLICSAEFCLFHPAGFPHVYFKP